MGAFFVFVFDPRQYQFTVAQPGTFITLVREIFHIMCADALLVFQAHS
jgi:hypothetical protein